MSDSGSKLRYYCEPEDVSMQQVPDLSASTLISQDFDTLPDAEPEQSPEALDSRKTCRHGYTFVADIEGFAVITRPSRFFNMGRVFKTLWTEPAGGTMSTVDRRFYNDISFGQSSFTKMRRFVVVRKRLHSCLCIAIYTYGGQGATKSNVRSQDHAVVYAHGAEEPIPLPDEQSKKGAFPIIVEEPSETIDPMSRLDFSRVYTIEHNLKVLKIGRISPEHHERLEKYFVESIVPPKDNPDPDYEPESLDQLVDSERLDSSFKARRPRFFNAGRVFSTLWTEESDGDTSGPEIRSFVVVGEGAQSSNCLRVRTFYHINQRPETLLTETDLSEYGLVYSNKVPKSVTGVKKKSLRVELSQAFAGGEIREPSLLHYRKLYQIEHDVRAKDIGHMDSRNQKLLHEYSSEYTLPDTHVPAPSNDVSAIITGINDALELASTVLQYIGDVKEFSEDIVKIRDEVSSTMGLLFTLASRMKKAEDEQGDEDRAWIATFQPLNVPGGPIEQFKSLLELAAARLVPADSTHKLGTPLKWALEKEDIDGALIVLARQKSRLLLALQNDPETDEYVVVD